MGSALELAGAAAAVGLCGLLVRTILPINDREHPAVGAAPGWRQAAGVNALGFLLVGAFVAGSGLVADALCRLAG